MNEDKPPLFTLIRFMLEIGTTVYKVYSLYNGTPIIKEVVICPHRSNTLEPTAMAATADETDLVTNKVHQNIFIGKMEAEQIECALKEGMAETNFCYIYADRKAAIEDYNRLIQTQIDWFESRKLSI